MAGCAWAPACVGGDSHPRWVIHSIAVRQHQWPWPPSDNANRGVEEEYDEEYDEEKDVTTITIYGEPTSFNVIQKKLEADGFEEVGGEFTYIPNDVKDVTPEQRETINKMVEKLEEFDDVQTVYTNMKPE